MRIGIVNDSRIACEVLARTVRSLPGFMVLWTAHDGREAIDMCAQELPDIVLMDLIMPNVDGAQATREIMKATPCVILVVTSSVTAHRDKVFEAMGYGALDAVTTPVMGKDGELDGDEALKQKLKVVSRLVERSGADQGDGAGEVPHACAVAYTDTGDRDLDGRAAGAGGGVECAACELSGGGADRATHGRALCAGFCGVAAAALCVAGAAGAWRRARGGRDGVAGRTRQAYVYR